uniref:Uncharacterized protein n=1 Tax=Cacopsylla melanoneura TaxID=428564 RepID=A0A8D9EDQ3_9HEMI
MEKPPREQELIQRLQIEQKLLVKAVEHVDNYINKLLLEQDHIKSCLQEFVEPTDPLVVESGTEENTNHADNPPSLTSPLYSMMDNEENVQAINSKPLDFDFDIDEIMPNTEASTVKMEAPDSPHPDL